MRNIPVFLLLWAGKKKNYFDLNIKERIWLKLQGWKEKLLSQAGMEVLLIVMVQATPTFSISCFKLCIILYHVFNRGNDPKILVGLRDNRKKNPLGQVE